jgi:hypothetical protein
LAAGVGEIEETGAAGIADPQQFTLGVVAVRERVAAGIAPGCQQTVCIEGVDLLGDVCKCKRNRISSIFYQRR